MAIPTWEERRSGHLEELRFDLRLAIQSLDKLDRAVNRTRERMVRISERAIEIIDTPPPPTSPSNVRMLSKAA